MQDLLDRALGKYVIIEEIGRGGMGAVYKARDVELDRVVAIKVLSPYLVGEPRLVQRFMREARLAANLDHPNIVTIYDIGGEGSYYYFAMKYLDGTTLKEYVVKNGPLTPEEALPFVRQLASALDYAHGQNLIHRDVKPGNVIVSSDGHVCLTDFGLAKVAENLKLTASGDTIGTLEYMAPEQARGAAEKGSDIYSLGVIVYEMLTGRLPFQGNNQATLLYQHLHDPPPPLHQWNPSIPPEVEKAVLKAMAKAPADRYQTAGAFYAALEEAVRKSLPVAPARRPAEPEKPPSTPPPGGAAPPPRAAPAGPSWLAPVWEKAPWLKRAWDKTTCWLATTWEKGAARVPWSRLPPFVQQRRWIVPAALGAALLLLLVILLAVALPSAPSLVVIPPTATPTAPPPSSTPTASPSPTPTPVPPTPTPTPTPTVPPEPVTAEVALVCGVNETGEGERPRLAHWKWGQGAPTVWPGLPNHPVVSLLSWSPAGDRIALIVAEFGVPNLFVVSREGELLKLTDSTTIKSDPTWAPDGVQIAYANGPEKKRDIYLIPARGGGAINDVTNSPRFDEWAPAWSADGAYILLAGKDNTLTNTEIFRLDPLSGARLRLTTAAGEDIFPAGSPDGTRIAFLSNRAGLGSDFLVYVMDSDGQNARLLYDQPVWLERPAWSPDGRWLALTRRVADALPQVIFLNTATGEVYPGPSGCRRPAWRP